MKHEEQEFTEIISSLQKLSSIKPGNAFKNRMQHVFVPVSPYAMPFFALRVAVVVFVVLLSGTTVAAATKQSKPGDMLYPVKQLAEHVTTNFSPRAEISKIPETQSPKPQQQTTTEQKTPSPTPTIIQKQKETTRVKFAPTTTSMPPSPTPTPAQQSVLPAKAAQKAVDNVLEKVPDHVKLKLGGSSQPTPTPKPKHEGSKDNGSNAGAGGSLLPKIKIGL